MSGLPENWRLVTLGDFCEVKGGKRIPKGEKFEKQKTAYPYIRVSDFENRSVLLESVQYISLDIHRRISQYTISSDDIYISIAGTIGVVGTIPDELNGANLTENAAKLTCLNAFDQRYLLYYLSSEAAQNHFRSQTVATSQPKLALFRIKTLQVPLPPLAEQQRIADKLDALLARVDACRARLGRVPALLKRFRQAVLAAAVAGRLTEDWRGENPELLSSQELVARLSQRISKNSQGQLRLNDAERFIEADLPSGWQFAPVSLVGDVYLGRQRSPENHNGPYMRSYMRAANITWQGWDLSDVKQMNFDPKDFARYKLQVGDVLINEGSGSADEVGKPAIWQGDVEDCCFQNTLICVRPYEEMSKYLYFVFLHAAMSKSFVEDTRGVNIYHIGKDRFSAYLIPLPSLAEQYEIIRRVETLFAYADRLEARLAATRARVDQLTPSLLGQAFRGELNAE